MARVKRALSVLSSGSPASPVLRMPQSLTSSSESSDIDELPDDGTFGTLGLSCACAHCCDLPHAHPDVTPRRMLDVPVTPSGQALAAGLPIPQLAAVPDAVTPTPRKRVRKGRAAAAETPEDPPALCAPAVPASFEMMAIINVPDKTIRNKKRKTRHEKQPQLKFGPTPVPLGISWDLFLPIVASSPMLNVAVERLRTLTFQWKFAKPANSVLVPLTSQAGLDYLLTQV
jgi:hypothetical protein